MYSKVLEPQYIVVLVLPAYTSDYPNTVEYASTNRRAVGSDPTWGAKKQAYQRLALLISLYLFVA
jgi:hypothetical protein